VDRGAVVDRQHAERLQALRALQRFAYDPGTFIGGLIAIAAQARDMQEHIGHAVVRDDEPEPLGHIEPLDHAGNLDDGCCRIAKQITIGFGF